MVYIFNAPKLNKLLLYCTCAVFSITSAIPMAYSQEYSFNIIDDSATVIRLEKTIKKLWKQEKKGNVNEMIDLMIEVKTEVELSTKKKISLESNLNQIQKDIEKNGGKIHKKQFENFKKKVKKKEKRANFHAQYVEMVLANPLMQFDDNEELMLYQASSKEDKDDKEEDQKDTEVNLPARVAFGVTLALCGVFLYILPSPSTKTWGQKLIETGILIAVEGGISKTEKDEDKKKDKK